MAAAASIVHTHLTLAEVQQLRVTKTAVLFNLPIKNGNYDTTHIHLIPTPVKNKSQDIELCVKDYVATVLVIFNDRAQRSREVCDIPIPCSSIADD